MDVQSVQATKRSSSSTPSSVIEPGGKNCTEARRKREGEGRNGDGVQQKGSPRSFTSLEYLERWKKKEKLEKYSLRVNAWWLLHALSNNQFSL